MCRAEESHAACELPIRLLARTRSPPVTALLQRCARRCPGKKASRESPWFCFYNSEGPAGPCADRRLRELGRCARHRPTTSHPEARGPSLPTGAAVHPGLEAERGSSCEIGGPLETPLIIQKKFGKIYSMRFRKRVVQTFECCPKGSVVLESLHLAHRAAYVRAPSIRLLAPT